MEEAGVQPAREASKKRAININPPNRYTKQQRLHEEFKTPSFGQEDHAYSFMRCEIREAYRQLLDDLDNHGDHLRPVALTDQAMADMITHRKQNNDACRRLLAEEGFPSTQEDEQDQTPPPIDHDAILFDEMGIVYSQFFKNAHLLLMRDK